jgi:hypothetical protein
MLQAVYMPGLSSAKILSRASPGISGIGQPMKRRGGALRALSDENFDLIII